MMADLAPLRVGSLFSGIGGLELGLERAGMTTVWQVENDDWCRRILAKHWPNVTRYEDIHDVDPADLDEVDLICGGFPCQPVSNAGLRKAQDDDRWLWPEFFRIVRVVRPRYVVVENVPGLATAGMGDVLGDLASIGYDTEWTRISAASVGAPHLRWRIFIVAYPGSAGGGRVRRMVVDVGDGRRSGGSAGGASVRPSDGEARSNGTIEGGQNVADTKGERLRVGRQEPEGRPGSGRSGPDVAHSPSVGFQGCDNGGSDPTSGRGGGVNWWAVEPSLGRLAHGIPRRVDRLRGLGNAVVPQVAEKVGRLIHNHYRLIQGSE